MTPHNLSKKSTLPETSENNPQDNPLETSVEEQEESQTRDEFRNILNSIDKLFLDYLQTKFQEDMQLNPQQRQNWPQTYREKNKKERVIRHLPFFKNRLTKKPTSYEMSKTDYETFMALHKECESCYKQISHITNDETADDLQAIKEIFTIIQKALDLLNLRILTEPSNANINILDATYQLILDADEFHETSESDGHHPSIALTIKFVKKHWQQDIDNNQAKQLYVRSFIYRICHLEEELPEGILPADLHKQPPSPKPQQKR